MPLSSWTILLAMVVVPQALSFAIARLACSLRWRIWVGPPVAAAASVLGWYLIMSVHSSRFVELGDGEQLEVDRLCGAAGAMLVVGLIVLTSLNGAVAVALQVVTRLVAGRRPSASTV